MSQQPQQQQYAAFATTAELYRAIDAVVMTDGETSLSSRAVYDAYGPTVNDWNVSQITDMSELFSAHRNVDNTFFNFALDSWDTSSATDMTEIFFSAEYFNQPLNAWHTDKVTSLSLGTRSYM